VIVLDTHAWIWWVSNPELLSAKAKTVINNAIEASELCVSSISAWEVAVLVGRGRLQLTMGVRDWIARSESLPFLRFVPVNNNIAIRSVELDGEFHGDPADRIIVATTLSIGANLITKDKKILNYPHVKALW